jgi:hypothetical protein
LRLIRSIGKCVPGGDRYGRDQLLRCHDRHLLRTAPYLREALGLGLRLTVVSKWYHRRAVHALRTLLPEAAPFYAILAFPEGDGQLGQAGSALGAR